MHNTSDKNSDIDDISINTNLKVFNGGLGLLKNSKKDNNKKNIRLEKTKSANNLHERENKFKENKFKEINLDRDSLIETEGIISFRSKKVNKTDQEGSTDFTNITNGIINKIDKMKVNTKKEHGNFSNNIINNNNQQEEMTINKIFKLNDEKETEKEIKNFEKESQRIQSKILGGNPLESSSSESSVDENYEKYDGFNTQKIKRTIDDINMNNIKSARIKNQYNENSHNNAKNFKTYDKETDEKRSNFFEIGQDNKSSNKSESEDKEGNIFWNLKGNSEIEISNQENPMKRSKSLIERDFNLEKIRPKSRKSEKEIPISNFKGTLSKIDKGYAIFVTTDDVIMLLPSFLIPRNLGIGDSFTFKIFEGQKYNSKVNNIYEIQKKYTKTIGK